jgi:hypothetical protein
VYNYGSPRVGNVAFSRLYTPRVPSTFRVVVDGDMVPGWPKMFGIYRHGGIEVLIDAECGGNLIVNPTVVEKALRLRNRTSTTNHSLTTYRECLEACFSSNDLLEYLRKVRRQLIHSFPITIFCHLHVNITYVGLSLSGSVAGDRQGQPHFG